MYLWRMLEVYFHSFVKILILITCIFWLSTDFFLRRWLSCVCCWASIGSPSLSLQFLLIGRRLTFADESQESFAFRQTASEGCYDAWTRQTVLSDRPCNMSLRKGQSTGEAPSGFVWWVVNRWLMTHDWGIPALGLGRRGESRDGTRSSALQSLGLKCYPLVLPWMQCREPSASDVRVR